MFTRFYLFLNEADGTMHKFQIDKANPPQERYEKIFDSEFRVNFMFRNVRDN